METHVFTPLIIPAILEAKTFYWKSAKNAENRRKSERKTIETVTNFFSRLGFEIESGVNGCNGKLREVEFYFRYNESTNRVYKTLSLYKNGKTTNIKTIKTLVEQYNKNHQ